MHGPVGFALIFLFGSSLSFLEILVELLELLLLDAFEGVVTALDVVVAAVVLLALTPYNKGRIFFIWKLFPF